MFLNPICNSYERFGSFEAPKYVSWSHQNRSQLVRIPAAINERLRMELRSPDPSSNPYIAFALIMAAGIWGIESSLDLPPALDVNLYNADEKIINSLSALPQSLSEAIVLAENSQLVKSVIDEEFLTRYISFKKEEASAFELATNKKEFYKNKYFYFI